jgi:uncharacterized protein YndB with AHSA1/START domain
MAEQASREIELTKIVDAPRDLVFAAFTDADHLVKWWGPEGFDCSSATSDPVPGGAFTIVMRSPEGHETPVEGRFLELDPPSRLVAETVAVGPDGTRMIEGTTTVDLVELDGKTEIHLRARAVALVPEADPALGGMELGWTSSLRCLDDHLTGAVDRQIVLMRMLEASPERVFEVWTTPEHVAAWFGPDGFTLTTDAMDVRPGGEWVFTMHGPDGVDYPNRVVYEVVDAPTLLVFLHGGEPDDPPFRQTVTFDPFMGGTLLTMKAVWDRAEDRDRNVERSGAIEGGEQTLDRLAAYVAGR